MNPAEATGRLACLLNPLARLISLTGPRYVPFSAWLEHIPFGMFLVDLLRPRTIVELGTHYGASYCAFCQAVMELRLDARCFAIDTWRGDPHAGLYGPEVLAQLRAHHDPLYGGFSRLVQSTFDDALAHFGDRSIDLLHIDGYHTYEAVKHDCEAWLPKMSERGVILFHDVNVREGDFEVSRFWEEVRARYPSFEMLHGHGLGVLAVGEVRSPEFDALLATTGEEAAALRDLFFTLGHPLDLKHRQLPEINARLAEANALAEARQAEIHTVSAKLAQAEQAAGHAARELAEREAALRAMQARLDERSAEVSVLRVRLEQEERLHTLTEQVRAALAVPYRQMIQQLRGVVRDVIPAGATVAVVSRGDEELLQLDGRPAWHFPRSADGCYAGAYPADSDGAIGHLESLRLRGAEYLVFPDTAMWWLDHYREFANYLQSRYRVAARIDGVCRIFALRKSPAQQGGRPAAAGQTPSGLGTGGARGAEYCRLVERVRQVVADLVPHGATVAVVSRGDDDLLRLNGRRAGHFPQREDGVYLGYHPADSAGAIAHLEALRARGVRYLVFPRTAFWWLEHYADFRRHLEQRYRVAVRDESTCVIFALRQPAGPVTNGGPPAR
jgi:hypothetical protein